MSTIKRLLILPPFAIGRLGSADEPMDNYTIEIDPPATDDKEPLGYRTLMPLPTLMVGERSGEIEHVKNPPFALEFKRNGRIRPVAPFLEVFAVTEEDEEPVPLTLGLLQKNNFDIRDISWRVWVANRKVARRTGDEGDVVATGNVTIADHDIHTLHGLCPGRFASDKDSVIFGQARFIKPNHAHPQIRLRFTPAQGLIYGPKDRHIDVGDDDSETRDRLYVIPDAQAILLSDKSIWPGYEDISGDPEPPKGAGEEDWKVRRKRIWTEQNKWNPAYDNETVPPALFAIDPPAPSWLYDNEAVSRGYFDDACDGFVEVRLARPGKERDALTAVARICSAPPAMAPDSLFVRSLADDLDQAIYGPDLPDDEPTEVTRARAQDVVRRAFETVRFMNVAVMNGNDYRGRSALSLDSMPEEEAADTERAIRPVMHPGTVDTKAITTLHQQVYAALRAGVAPWFARILRNPNEAADFTDNGRRKMPALMCAADNNYLALTWRQIHSIEKAASTPPAGPAKPFQESLLKPRNLAARRHAAIHHEAAGNPISSRPITSVANCCPGLEVDFRAVWRRLFKGIELREHDNLVVRVDDPAFAKLQGRRLLRVIVPNPRPKQFVHMSASEPAQPSAPRDQNANNESPTIEIWTTTPIKGPAPSDPNGYIVLTTDMNPNGLAPLEWSNALAYVLPNAGNKVHCDFSNDVSWDKHVQLVEAEDGGPNYDRLDLEVQPFFKDETAVISEALAKAGELTQGLCSPWQNDYRECSCYYWASARPDFVNVQIDGDGLSAGDNWFQRERTGNYVPDDYADSRLVMYDELFRDWESLLKFEVGGRDKE